MNSYNATLTEKIYEVLDRTGLDILNNRRRFLSYLGDLAPEFSREHRIISNICDEHYFELFYKASCGTSDEIDAAVNRASVFLIQECQLSREAADRFASAFGNAIKMVKGYVIVSDINDYLPEDQRETEDIFDSPKDSYDEGQPIQRVQPRSNKLKILIPVVIALLIILAGGFLVKHFLISGSDGFSGVLPGGMEESGADVDLISSVSHQDKADKEYEIAAIFQVRNKVKDKALTSVSVNVDGSDVDQLTAYGYAAPGEEGLMCVVWHSEDALSDDIAYHIEVDEYSYSSEAPQDYQDIKCELTDHGTNVTMETGHDSNGYANEWDDDSFARYKIKVNNSNDISIAQGQSSGVAVIYGADNKLSDGDIFYNTVDSIGADDSVEDFAVLPKDLATQDDVRLFILPVFE